MPIFVPPPTPEELREDLADRYFEAATSLRRVVRDMDLMAGTEWTSAVAEEEQEAIQYISEVGPRLDLALMRLCVRLKGYKAMPR